MSRRVLHDYEPTAGAPSPVILYDSSGRELDFRQEAENVNAADHGILIFARDYESSPQKYRMIRCGANGYLEVFVEGPNGQYVQPHSEDFDTGGTTENVSAFGIAVPASGGAGVVPGDETSGLWVNVKAQAARAATTDTITAKLATDAIQNGTTALTPKFAIIDAATSGDNTLVAAVSAKKIRVLQAFLISAGTVTTRFESGAGGTALTGQMNLVANTGYVLPFSPVGWFETASNTLLNLELSAAISVDGSLTYVEV